MSMYGAEKDFIGQIYKAYENISCLKSLYYLLAGTLQKILEAIMFMNH